MDLEPLRVQELLEVDAPRERLLNLGAPALSHTELVSMLLGDSDAELTHRLLRKFRSLRTLARCEPRELASVEGMSMDDAIRLAVTFELGRRASKEVLTKLKVDSPDVVCQLMAQDLRALTRESLRVLLLDTKYQLHAHRGNFPRQPEREHRASARNLPAGARAFGLRDHPRPQPSFRRPDAQQG